MALINVFEQYGIKEVADVTIYKLGKDENGATTELNVFPFTTPAMPY
jgi:hypothetical protein